MENKIKCYSGRQLFGRKKFSFRFSLKFAAKCIEGNKNPDTFRNFCLRNMSEIVNYEKDGKMTELRFAYMMITVINDYIIDYSQSENMTHDFNLIAGRPGKKNNQSSEKIYSENINDTLIAKKFFARPLNLVSPHDMVYLNVTSDENMKMDNTMDQCIII